MSLSHRSISLQRCLLALALISGVVGGFLRQSESTAALATPGASGAFMAQATVDDVTIRLISWTDSDSWQGLIEATNNNAFAVSIAPALIQLESSLPDGTIVVSLLRTSDPTGCDLAPGVTGQLKLDFAFIAGQSGTNLTVGVEEPDRTGAKVIFPLNSNNGPSAIGGSGNTGGTATGGDAIGASGTPAATAGAFATPIGSPQATPANVCAH